MVVSLAEAFVTLTAIVSLLCTIVVVCRLALDHDRRKTLMRQDHEHQMEMLRHEHRIAETELQPPRRSLLPQHVIRRIGQDPYSKRLTVEVDPSLTLREIAEIADELMRRL